MARRRSRQRGDFSGGNLQLFGFEEIVRKIDRLAEKKELNRIIYKALTESAKPVMDDMEEFMDTHREGMPTPETQDTPPRGTGQSNRYTDMHGWWRGNRFTLQVGFKKADYKKGASHEAQMALQALFLDIGTRMLHGTPRITPTFFIYYAVDNNRDLIKLTQERVLTESLRELWMRNQGAS